MKTVLGCIRRADEDFSLIGDGDRIAVGVSGGKDSLLLLYALSLYRRFSHKNFALSAITLDMGLRPFDVSGIRALCERIEVPYTVVETQIAQVIFDIRKEPNPCALCAKMRRGALAAACGRLGYGKLALGHHRDDALETLVMSVLFEGRIHTFHPITRLDRAGIVQIRPLVYAPEKQMIAAARRLKLPVVKSPCPVNGETRRAEVKGLLDALCRRYPDARERLLGALKNEEQYSLWEHGDVLKEERP